MRLNPGKFELTLDLSEEGLEALWHILGDADAVMLEEDQELQFLYEFLEDRYMKGE